MPKSSVAQSVKALASQARALISELETQRETLKKEFSATIEKAWRLGQKLSQIKAMVGHGNWYTWLEANLEISRRHASRHMELADANPHATKVEELTAASIRQFYFREGPEKERLELPGDQSLPRVCHHLTLLNDWRRFTRRVEIGQVTLNKEEAKRDLEPLYKWLRGLYGEEAA